MCFGRLRNSGGGQNRWNHSSMVQAVSHPAPVAPRDLHAIPSFGDRSFVQLERFLEHSFASELADALLERLLFERVELGGITELWRGERTLGDAYFGQLQWRERPAPEAAALDALLDGDWARALVSRVAGEPLQLMRPGTPYLMKQGDRICLHDDMSDPDHRLALVLNLTRGWTRQDGGLTLVGQVASVEPIPTPPEVPFQLKRWSLKEGHAELVPTFNTLTLIRTDLALAHGVSPIISAEKSRLSIVALYGSAWAQS